MSFTQFGGNLDISLCDAVVYFNPLEILSKYNVSEKYPVGYVGI